MCIDTILCTVVYLWRISGWTNTSHVKRWHGSQLVHLSSRSTGGQLKFLHTSDIYCRMHFCFVFQFYAQPHDNSAHLHDSLPVPGRRSSHSVQRFRRRSMSNRMVEEFPPHKQLLRSLFNRKSSILWPTSGETFFLNESCFLWLL